MNGESTADDAERRERPGQVARPERPERPERVDRKAQRRERGRRDILDAAERALGERGDLTALTMDDIASEAGFTAGALYGYFRSKQAIVQALLRRMEEELLAAIAEPEPRGLSFAALLEWRLGRLAEVGRGHLGLFHAFLVHGWGAEAEALDELFQLHEAFLRGLDELLTRGIQDGCIKDICPRDLSLALIGVQREFFTHWLYSDRSEPLDERMRRAMTIFLSGAAVARCHDEKGD